MAIIQGVTDVFRVAALGGTLSALSNTWKIALYTSQASLGPDTVVYTTSGEVVAAGYTAGGATLDPSNITVRNHVAMLSFTDVTWTGVITARGALIYDATNANQAVCVLDFGADKTSAATFTVQFPPYGPTTAILRMK